MFIILLKTKLFDVEQPSCATCRRQDVSRRSQAASSWSQAVSRRSQAVPRGSQAVSEWSQAVKTERSYNKAEPNCSNLDLDCTTVSVLYSLICEYARNSAFQSLKNRFSHRLPITAEIYRYSHKNAFQSLNKPLCN